jgi:hypothetical protein
MLNEFSPDERRIFLEIQAKTGSVDRTMEIFEADYPQAHKYSRYTYYKFLKTPTGKDELSAVKQESEVVALEEGLSQKANRVIILGEIGLKAYNAVVKLDPSDKEYIPLSRELRECIREIRVEMEGEGGTHGQAAEAMNAFFDLISGKGSPDWIQDALKSPTSPPSN